MGTKSWWYVLLLLPFVGVLFPPLYNRLEPSLLGLPFFYWYQLAWVIVSSLLTAVVYLATRPDGRQEVGKP